MTELWVERTGVRRYTGHSSRGAEVLVGSEDVEGVFTPGELMKIALVGSVTTIRRPSRCQAQPTASRSATRYSRRSSRSIYPDSPMMRWPGC